MFFRERTDRYERQSARTAWRQKLNDFGRTGAPCAIRTRDPRIRSPTGRLPPSPLSLCSLRFSNRGFPSSLAISITPAVLVVSVVVKNSGREHCLWEPSARAHRHHAAQAARSPGIPRLVTLGLWPDQLEEALDATQDRHHEFQVSRPATAPPNHLGRGEQSSWSSEAHWQTTPARSAGQWDGCNRPEDQAGHWAFKRRAGDELFLPEKPQSRSSPDHLGTAASHNFPEFELPLY